MGRLAWQQTHFPRHYCILQRSSVLPCGYFALSTYCKDAEFAHFTAGLSSRIGTRTAFGSITNWVAHAVSGSSVSFLRRRRLWRHSLSAWLQTVEDSFQLTSRGVTSNKQPDERCHVVGIALNLGPTLPSLMAMLGIKGHATKT